MAPAAAGSALVGQAAGDVDQLLSWERGDLAGLFSEGGAPSGRWRAELARFDLALAYTRDELFARQLAALVPRVIVHDPAPARGHASEWLAAALTDLGIGSDEALPPPAATRQEQVATRTLRARLNPDFLAIHAGSGSKAKNWPAERFASLARRLSASRPWLLVEGPADAEPVAALAGLPGAVRAREIPPRALAALLAEAGTYVGNDSGVTHLAAAWGAPTLALFGPTDPAMWAPLGPRVRVLRSATGAMDGLQLEDVLNALCRRHPDVHATDQPVEAHGNRPPVEAPGLEAFVAQGVDQGARLLPVATQESDRRDAAIAGHDGLEEERPFAEGE